MKRRMVIVLLGLLLACSAVVVPSGRAYGWDMCKDAPLPVGPRDGMAGMVTVRPKEIPEVAPDPFADPSIPIGDVYGYNWSWSNYDMGCGNEFLSDPAAVAATMQGNTTLGIVSVFLAELDTLEWLARDAGVPWFTDLVVAIAAPLRALLIEGVTRDGVTIPGWIPVAVLVAGVAIVFSARKARLAQTARIVLTVGVCIVLSYGVLYLPTAASQAADKLVVDVSRTAGTGMNTSLSDGPNRHGAYRVWLTGWFGSADSDLANELGPQLVAATHYSWSDVQVIERDPSQRERINAAKAEAFKTVANKVKERDPGAYERFKGKSGGDRIGIATMGLFTVICMNLFAIVACVMILLGRVIMQALVVAAPIGAGLGIIPGQGHVLRRMWDLFVAALIGVVKYMIAAGLMAMVLSALARLDPVTAPVWMIIATITALVLTKPARTFKTMVPGLDPNRSYIKEGFGHLVSFATQMGNMTDKAFKPKPSARNAGDSKAGTEEPEHVTVLTQPSPALETSTPNRPALTGPARRELEAAPDRAPITVTTLEPLPPAQPPAAAVPARAELPASVPSHTPTADPAPRRAVADSGPSPVIQPSGVIIQPPAPGETSPETKRVLGPQTGEEYVRLPEPDMDSDGRSHELVLYVPPRQKVMA